ncbi:FHA domain-containing protein [Myxococcota bacterium]
MDDDSSQGNNIDEVQYPELRIDPELMDKLRDIVARREEVQELVRKAEASKTKVKPAIYSKVVTDYQNRLKSIAGEFAPVSEDVKRGLEEIQTREQDIRARLQEVTDDLEEQRFRCQLGEFATDELEPMEQEMLDVQRELNDQIDVLEGTYEECSRCLREDHMVEEKKEGESKPSEAPADTVMSEADSIVAQITGEAQPLAKAPSPPPPPEAQVETMPPPPAPAEAEASAPAKPETPAAKPEKKPAAAKEKGPPPPAKEKADPLPKADSKAEKAGAVAAIKLLKKNGDAEVYPLKSEKLSIGRSSKSDIVLKVAGVSRTHAHVVKTGHGQYTIIDTSGGGGITINGKKQKKATLKHGDRITIASIEMEIVPA